MEDCKLSETSTKASASSSVQSRNPAPKAKPKPSTGVWRKQYKRMKPGLKRLIEEKILVQEKLRRKQDKLAEMSRDIHYLLGRLVPYEKNLAASSTKFKDKTAGSFGSPQTMTESSAEVKSEQERLTWEGSDIWPTSNGTDKNHLSLVLSAEMERQLVSIVSDKETLTLPDNIFSES